MVMHGRVISRGGITPRTVCIKMFCTMRGKVIRRMGETRSLLRMHIGRHQQIAEQQGDDRKTWQKNTLQNGQGCNGLSCFPQAW